MRFLICSRTFKVCSFPWKSSFLLTPFLFLPLFVCYLAFVCSVFRFDMLIRKLWCMQGELTGLDPWLTFIISFWTVAAHSTPPLPRHTDFFPLPRLTASKSSDEVGERKAMFRHVCDNVPKNWNPPPSPISQIKRLFRFSCIFAYNFACGERAAFSCRPISAPPE